MSGGRRTADLQVRPAGDAGGPEGPPSALRSATMRAIKSRDTLPEKAVRALLRRFAPGYRLNRGDLPGKPDIAYIGRKRAIFVHGCFWHGHCCPRGGRAPKTNADYWAGKIARNRARDAAAQEALAAMGWGALVVWECELRDAAEVAERLRKFVGEPFSRPSREKAPRSAG